MKYSILKTMLWVALVPVGSNLAIGQDGPIPVTRDQLHVRSANDSLLSIKAATPAAPSVKLPLLQYSIVSPRDGQSYHGSIVSGPLTGAQSTTTVPVVIIPLVLKFKYSPTTTITFDPTATDTGCLGAGNTALSLTKDSPIFNPNFAWSWGGTNVGARTTYNDAFQRAEFWTKVSPQGENYHIAFGTSVAPVQTVTVYSSNTSPANGTVYSVSGVCGTAGGTNKPGALGVANLFPLDAKLQQIITNLGLTPAQFPFFVTYNAVLSIGDSTNLNNCCVLGYHNSLGTSVANPGQTYGIAEFEGRDQTVFSGVSDVAVMSHEVGEWLNDPSGLNPTPAWGHTGQVSGCQNNFEVGDPLTGTLMPVVLAPNGFGYHLQELAFFSWFYGPVNFGVNGWYSNNDTFSTDAGGVCH